MPKIRKCRVRGCGSTSEGVFRLFCFPNEWVLAEKWKENLKISPTDHFAATNSFVCEKHFQKEAIGARRLKKDAVPTLELDEAPTQLFEPAPPLKRCCISNCAGGEKLFKFPKTEVARNNWVKACNLDLPVKSNLYICEKHFHEKDVSSHRILNEALPARNLGHEENSQQSSDWVLPPVLTTYNVKKTDVSQPDDMSVGNPNDISFEEFEKYSRLHEIEMKCDEEENISVCDHEHYARVARRFQNNALKQAKKIKELKRRIFLLTRKCQALKKNIIVTGGANDHAITFAKMIVKNKNSYSEKEKAMALNINYMSTRAYNFMRDDLGFALPHKKTLLRWRPIRYVCPGIDENFL
ncbi:uncharacterized protein LOC125779375 [Bactrocera dorsalis]|uniref:Uncharacterized protein LOC125779375 n=1 Tax=Bactrocera dorsalis TaxID=27457 RepID=A0ABM3K5A3_BACDO|nr:uncharacterized protein LOC125779375 [Bactrocera dorsalis]